MFPYSATAALISLNKPHSKPCVLRGSIEKAQKEISTLQEKMHVERLEYIGWRNKVRKLFYMKTLSEKDAHEVLAHPSDIFDSCSGYPAYLERVEYLTHKVNDSKNISQGYYEYIA